MTGYYYFIFTVFVSMHSGFMAIYLLLRRKTSGSGAFMALMCCVSLLAVSEILSMISATPAAALFWFNFRTIFLASIPVLWLVFAFEFGGWQGWWSRSRQGRFFSRQIAGHHW